MSSTRLVFAAGSFSLGTIPADCEYLLKKLEDPAQTTLRPLDRFLSLSPMDVPPNRILFPPMVFQSFFQQLPVLLVPLPSLQRNVGTRPASKLQVRYARVSNYRYARIWSATTVPMEPRGSIELFASHTASHQQRLVFVVDLQRNLFPRYSYRVLFRFCFLLHFIISRLSDICDKVEPVVILGTMVH